MSCRPQPWTIAMGLLKRKQSWGERLAWLMVVAVFALISGLATYLVDVFTR